MSAEDNLGRQWTQPELSFTVYRGLTQTPKKNNRIGMHWSLNPRVAINVAKQGVTREKRELGMGTEGHPTVLKGTIPMSSIEMDPSELHWRGVHMDPEDFKIEQEVPLKWDAPIYVTERTQYKKKTRTRRYNPPREMKN